MNLHRSPAGIESDITSLCDMSLHRNPAGFLGIVMLQTRFPRPLGDIGHPGSFGFPVRYLVVPGATPGRVVRERAAGLLQPFIEAGRQLVREGAAAITTSCGFLAIFQAELAAALPVPVWTSSLLKLPELRAPGVITVDAASLTADHLRAAGADGDVPVVGLAPGCSLQQTLMNDEESLDMVRAESDTVAAARELLARSPKVSDIVFECTNLAPYAMAVMCATGLPVHHIVGLLHERFQVLKESS